VRAYVVIFVIALVVCATLTPVVRALAARVGAFAPASGRHVHQQQIPRLGGVAIVAAFLSAVGAMFFVASSSHVAFIVSTEWRKGLALLIGGAAMAALGIRDDTKGIRALYKLYAHIAVAILAFALGFRIEAIAVPFVGELSMGIFALPVTVIWIVGVINAINLIDGLDGLAGGIAFFACVTNFVVGYMTDQLFVCAIMAASLGAILGFLFYNFNPARIFMGDSGSYFLGYMLGTMSLCGTAQKTSTAVSLVVPVVALGVPIFDTLFAIVRRFLERRPIFSPDRGHIHHRLLDMGITHRRAVLILYAISIVFTVAAIGVSLGRSWQVGVAILVACVVMLGFVRFVGYFEYLHKGARQRARLRSRHAELLRRLLPEVPALFAAAQTEAEVLGAMGVVTRRAQLRSVEIARGPTEPSVVRWESNDDAGALHELVRASFPVGRDATARAHVRFAWHSDFGDVSPQSEVLLQVVVDVLEGALARVGSDLAPVAPPREERASRPVVTPAPVSAGTDAQ
jgi:UDP-GlcNAc:undecaprenyl-phosphate GlcNAc-1-phosphate transferase